MAYPYDPEAMMRRAINLAWFSPVPDPNPRVGAVILNRHGVIVGEGWHQGAGTPHAEVVALAQAGQEALDGTAFVSLEPCAHTGRTGPCTGALLAAGIRTVYYAQRDPNPHAMGGGDVLRAAGLTVSGGLLADQAQALNAAWTTSMIRQRPMVTYKVAGTLDGRAAAADGSSQWITGVAARADVHEQRSLCDAILVGTGTVLADNPRLTTRFADGTLRPRQPLRVVMGLRDIPAASRILDDAAPTRIVATRDPHAVLADLWNEGIRHVFLEGGPTVGAAFLKAGLVDEIIVYLAPALLGAGRPIIGDLGIATISDIARFDLADVTVIGDDIRIHLTGKDD